MRGEGKGEGWMAEKETWDMGRVEGEADKKGVALGNKGLKEGLSMLIYACMSL